jgi:hypothetical protein
MTELGIPEDGNRYAAVPPRIAAALANDLYSTFNNTVNRGALMDGFIGHLSGFDFFKTNFLKYQTAGLGQTGGTPPAGYSLGGVVTNGPIYGGNTINVSGVVASSQVFNVGDIITVSPTAGVYAVNPLNYNALQQTAQFVVTANVVSTVGGTASIPVNPTIIVSGARQNISAPIPNGAQLYLANSHNVSLAFHNQAIVFAAPPITELKGGIEAVTTYSDLYKMAMTYSLGADIRNYVQLDRIDVIAGVSINPEFACMIMS